MTISWTKLCIIFIQMSIDLTTSSVVFLNFFEMAFGWTRLCISYFYIDDHRLARAICFYFLYRWPLAEQGYVFVIFIQMIIGLAVSSVVFFNFFGDNLWLDKVICFLFLYRCHLLFFFHFFGMTFGWIKLYIYFYIDMTIG